MAGRVWDGSNVAQEMLKGVRDQILSLHREGHSPPVLAELWVGDAALGERWRAEQEEACRFTGISYLIRSFPLATDSNTILQTIADLNADPTVAGIVVHACNPAGRATLTSAVRLEKDVDGAHPLSIGRFLTHKCSPSATRGNDILELLKRADIDLVGAYVVCIGNASGLASAVAFLCLHENATIAAWRSTTARPAEMIRRADLLLIDTDAIPALDSWPLKAGVVIIDARSQADRWSQPPRAGWFDAVALLIPVPDGVGPTTIATRLSTLVTLYHTQAKGQVTR